MENFEEMVLSKLEQMEQRLDTIENKPPETHQRRKVKNYTVPPDEVEYGHMAFVGRFKSKDGSMGSTFGDDYVEIDKLFTCNSFEMAKVIDAFSSEDRLNIVKLLIQRSLTARELMEELKFATTGKLYHHLSFLEKIGVIRKDEDQYHVSARYISCVLLIFAGVQSIINKNNVSYNS